MLSLMPLSTASCGSGDSSRSVRCKIEDTKILSLFIPFFQTQLICHCITKICTGEHSTRSILQWLDPYDTELFSLLDSHIQKHNTIAHLQKISVHVWSFRAPLEFYFFAVNYTVKYTKKVSKYK